MEQHTYRYLQGLVDSDFQIVDEEPNIIGWAVKSESGTFLGKVIDLLFDPQTRAVRYLIVDLNDNGMGLDDKKVMIPIGIAHLHTNDDEVVLPNVHIDQFNALPSDIPDQIGPETEVQIREIIGSPAALRIEEAISEFDQNEFYTHHHFNKDRFYQRGRSNEDVTSQEIAGTASMSDRVEEEETIHELIDNSRNHDLHAAAPETGVDTHHNEHKNIEDWKQEDQEDKPESFLNGDEYPDQNKPPYQS